MQRKMRRQAEQSKENKKKEKGGEVGGQKGSIAYYDLIPRDPRQEAPTCLCFLPCMLEISSTCHLR